jgi:hypothetical protein
MGETDAQWVADDADLPAVAISDAEHEGRPFIVLSGYYSWDDSTDDSRRKRGIWSNLYTHLVNTEDLPAAMGDLQSRDLTGHDMSRPPSSYDGYVGEFPYGHHHGQTIHVLNHEWDDSLSVSTKPAAWEILGEYEYASGYETVSLNVPAPELFGPVPGDLHWDGRKGWTDNAHRIVAVLRHTVNTSQNELLIDRDWLEQWLAANQKSLLWVENTGKDVYRELGRDGAYPGALTRSRVLSWTPGAATESGIPGWQRVPPRSDA